MEHIVKAMQEFNDTLTKGNHSLNMHPELNVENYAVFKEMTKHFGMCASECIR